MKERRSLKNYYLVPRLQLPLSAYSTFAAFIFVGIAVLLLYTHSKDTLSRIFELTDAGEQAKSLLLESLSKAISQLVIAALIFVILNFSLATFLSHRMVGPVVQFLFHTRELQKKNYRSRIHLRPGDGFEDLANELNTLAETLEKESSSKPAE